MDLPLTAAGAGAARTAPPSLLLGLGFAVLVRATGLLVMAWASRHGDPAAADVATFAAAIVGAAIVAALVLGMARAGRTTLRELGWSTTSPGRGVLLGVVGGLALVLATAGLVEVAEPGGFGSTLSAVASWTPRQRLLFLVIGTGAAFAEESAFRGWLQSAVSGRLGSWAGIPLVAGLFAVLHLAFHPVALAVKLVFGLVLGLLADRTRSLVAPALAHALSWVLLGLA
ncbi:MAG TPA: CPBP family intramembrane glutamic endopeptidase [Anaeromyxobacteraceae bacterium]|nr:CPBP family intramembrane glutamic endopeptidase [Anaeromyxobacteraceae bacterium]